MAALVIALAASAPSAARAADARILHTIRGSVSYRCARDQPLIRVTARARLPDDCFAVTGKDSVAVLSSADGTVLQLGADTTIQVGGNPVVVIAAGALRFDIGRDAAPYRFVSPTWQMTVRSGTALIATGPPDWIACLRCDQGDVSIDAGSQHLELASGELTTSMNGSMALSTITATELQAFRDAGLANELTGARPH